MHTTKTVPFYHKLPSGRLIPFVSDPMRHFSAKEVAELEVIAKIGFSKDGTPLK